MKTYINIRDPRTHAVQIPYVNRFVAPPQLTFLMNIL